MSRILQLAPVIFALVGAGAGICTGMLTHNTPPYQVHLHDSVPLALLGGVVGGFLGYGIMAAAAHRPRLVGPAGLVSAGLLGAAMMAPLGWIAGTDRVSRHLRYAELEDVEHLPTVGMAVAAAVGCVVGLAHAGALVLMDRRRPGAGPSAAGGPSGMSPFGDV